LKFINIKQAKNDLSALIEESQGEPICLTRHGKPAAVLLGVDGVDISDVIERFRSGADRTDTRTKGKGRAK
jgi:prevent-host-death family protein